MTGVPIDFPRINPMQQSPAVRGGKILRRSIYGENFWACKECLQEVKAWFAFCPRCGADLSEQEVMPNDTR